MRILHVFRTPVGGLFRHVRDVARGQSALGHEIGILCDSTTGGDTATRLLDSAAPHCALGVKRIPISRLPGLGDMSGIAQTMAHARTARVRCSSVPDAGPERSAMVRRNKRKPDD